jgi:hypothetical protein
MKTITLTREQIKERILELNLSLVTEAKKKAINLIAMTINDLISIDEIKEEISELINEYLGYK